MGVAPRADAGAELAIARRGEAGTAETRVIDRSFVEDGVRWIIDYKTADLGPAADAARLAAHAERYRTQLEAYAALFAARAGRCAWRCSMSRMASWRVWNTIPGS
jgi:ATP-dependent helicase/nuclease subunit A